MQKLNFYILDNLTKNQKSAFVSCLKIFTKKFSTLSCKEIWYKFLDEQQYLFEINRPEFPWMVDFISDERLEKDAEKVIYDVLQKLKYKEKMQPFIEKQKLLAKEARRRASEWRQSREKPTKKQVAYYKALCAQAMVDGVDLTNKSKLDLKNMISDLLNKKGSQDEL